MRTTAGVRLTLWFATLLMVGASLGLHPEPSDLLARSASATEISKTSSDVSPAHRCLACLTYGAALASALAGILVTGAAPSPATWPSGRPLSDRVAGRARSGRSPPARS